MLVVRRAVSQRCVQPDRVVVLAPLLENNLSFPKAKEVLAVEQLIAQLSVGAFSICILPGATGRDIEGLGTDAFQPLAHNLGCHLRTVVGSDGFWDAAHQHRMRER